MSAPSDVSGEHRFSVLTFDVNKLTCKVSDDYNVLSSPASGMNQSTRVAIYGDKRITPPKVDVKDRL